MNNQIIPFDFENKTIRTVIFDETPWWVGKDVCIAAGYRNPNKAMNDHCRGITKRYPIVDALGRTQRVRIIHEGDVWRLITNSHLPEAKRFEKWLFETALPEIRKTGALIPEGMTLVNEAVFESTIQNMVAYSHLRAEVDAFKKALVPQIADDRAALEEIARRYWEIQLVPQLKATVDHLVSEVSENQKLRDENRRLTRRCQFTPEDKQEILRLYAAGYKISDIKDKTKKGRTRIKRTIEEAATLDHPGLFDDESSESFGESLVDAARETEAGL